MQHMPSIVQIWTKCIGHLGDLEIGQMGNSHGGCCSAKEPIGCTREPKG
jgi:hypothetical protein